ncbi:MAG TPA: transporter substrate-binding domain-containing protein [Burkholderiaceae bacterium]
MRFDIRQIAAMLLLPCLQAMAADPIVLHTFIEADAEMKWGVDGKTGLCPEILKAIAHKDAGLKFVWDSYPVPQKRLVAEVEVGRIDFACALGRTPEREQQLIIPPIALYDDSLVAAVRRGDPLVLNALPDLKKLPLQDIILLTYGARLVGRLGELGIHQVDDGAKRPGDNLQKLARGRGRVFLFHEPGMAWEIRRAGLQDKLKILPTILSVDQHYLVLSRHATPEVVRRISDALTQLRNDGTLHNIAAHWSPRIDALSNHSADKGSTAMLNGAEN